MLPVVMSIVMLPVVALLISTNISDKMDVNDNMTNIENDSDSTITWDNVAAMEEAARDLEEVPASAPFPSWRDRYGEVNFLSDEITSQSEDCRLHNIK